jgi:hypothetical protein
LLGSVQDTVAPLPPPRHEWPPSDEELDAIMVTKGIDPHRFLNRRESVEMLKKHFGINYSVGYLGKLANLGTGPPYQIANGRAIMQPREFLRWVFSRVSAVRCSPEVRRPRTKPDKGGLTSPSVVTGEARSLAVNQAAPRETPADVDANVW